MHNNIEFQVTVQYFTILIMFHNIVHFNLTHQFADDIRVLLI